ncbi:FAD-dependent oxidoreductase [Rhodococcus pyridinivorans]|uniref:FAD-dependent oxidoreductase n=1 Tax=Rhodococcus pyridinivorans TaxID=103816 RepID=A0A7M2XLF0_9NOCA|nr:FAD-dependent oxidoreductase [Rhodococcus pyridinivorans]QOV98676.1 FAD-dependent oxidoreductase [Rhodococcus pyridinivorans]UPW02445.1 FAD-dependent oxidoreductase [Rhodococcus pyridinivorans]WMM72577.1 FAD-dependent oxidoreductase [Rhodococcus pyridinivorans]
MAETHTVLIVGAGHAGGTLAGLLRQQKFDGRIIMCGKEPHLPYHRPPLSKKYTDDEFVQWLKPESFYADNAIDTHLDDPVVRIDRSTRTVTTRSGHNIGYTTLVLATGAEPRTLTLPGSDLEGVLSLRTLSDAHQLRTAVQTGVALAIIGGGYVGLEVAASARANGCAVTVIEREDRVLARVASTELSAALTEFHRNRGTHILTEAKVQEIHGTDGRVTSVLLADGTEVPCGIVLVGIGAIPNDALGRDAGLNCVTGIVVDGAARTSDPHILAIGDVTYRLHDTLGTMVRLESIPSAVEQAKQAAAVITGTTPPSHEVPWFWSDQFDLKMKMAGMINPDTRAVLRGDPSNTTFSLFHVDTDGIPVAVETVNAAAEFMAGKKFIGNRTRVDTDALADPTVPLREAVL